MKALYRISLLLCLMAGSLWSSGQGTETFDNFPETSGSYLDGSFTGVDGSTWTYLDCRGDQSITDKSPMLGRDRNPDSEVTSGTISGGIGILNFDYKQAFSSNVGLDVYVNGALVTTVTSSGEVGVIKNSGDITVNVSGDFVLSFKNPGTAGQVNIDNVSWSSYVDETAPTFISTYPNVSGIVATGFTLNVQLDEPGTFYYAVVEDGTTAPTSSEVKAGTGFTLAGNSAVAEAEVTVSSVISGLTPDATYDVYVVAEDDEDPANIQDAPTLLADVMPTEDVTAPTLESAATGTGAAQTIVLTFDEAIEATDATGFSATINAQAATINGLTVNGATITLTIEEEIFVDDVVVLNYATGNVQDVSGNALGTITDQGVTNNATTVLVSSLTDLRSQSTGTTVYRLTGEVFFTYGFANRNQKYFQDANAGILIDDAVGAITTAYSFGDGVTGLEGQLGLNSGVLQFVPTSDPGAPTSTENVITPIEVDAATFKADINAYESRLIVMTALQFSTAGAQFSTSADSYTMTDAAAETIVFRDQYTEADYSSFEIPYGRLDIYGLASEFNGTAQIFPYSQTTSVLDNYAPDFTVAPAAENISYFSADITFTSDEPGTVYYTFVDDGADAPTISQMLEEASVRAMTVGANTHSFSELSDNIAYDLYMLAADDEGTPNVQGSLTKVDFTTLELLVDGDSDITATEPAIGSAVISSTATTDTDAVEVFDFIISDAGTADGLSTFVTGISIGKGALNTADWSTTLGGVELQVGEGSVAGVIGADAITFDWSAFPWEITDGGNSAMTLSVWLSESVVDGAVLQFEIPTGHAVTTDGSIGSTIMPTLNAAVTSAAHTIDVVASSFVFAYPQVVSINENFNMTAMAVDANNNIDTQEWTFLIQKFSGPGNLSTAFKNDLVMTNGTYSWNDVQFDVVGDYKITYSGTAQSGSLSGVTGTITAAEITGSVFFSEYIEGSSNNKALEIYNGKNVTIDLSLYKIRVSNNGAGFGLAATNPENYDITLSGSLAAGGVFVVANAAATAISDETDLALSFDQNSNPGANVTSFNGNDAVGLFEDDVLIDLIGDPSNASGTNWPVAGTGATSEFTLVRKNTVTTGNTTPLSSFGTNAGDSEWVVYPQNDFNYIGYHVFGEQPFPLILVDETGFNGSFGYVVNGNSSAVSSYSLSTEDLSENLVITPPVGYELSADEAFSGTIYTNASPWSISPTDGVVTQTVYVRFTPPTADGATYSGDITHTSTDADSKTVSVSGIEGAPAVNSINGIVINEILYDPNGTYNYDTDGSGAANTEDEFVEIYNTSESPVDISGWQLWDEGASAFFTFPAETILGAGNYAGVMSSVQAGGTLPIGTDGNLTFSVLSGMSLGNSGENVALLNTNSSVYVQVAYAGKATIDFSTKLSATIVGLVESWGTPPSGSSLVRSPEGGVTIVNHADIQGAESASFAAPAIDPNAPQISVSDEDGIHFGNLSISVTSEVQTYTVSGINLAGDIVVTAPSGFEVSTDGSNFSSSVNLTPTANEVAETTISVRFTAASFGSKDGEITHTSTDAFQIDLDVSGAGVDETTIAFISFANCDVDVFSSVSVTGAQEWRCAFTGETGNGYLMSGFASGAQENEDWLVGSFDLTSYAGAEFSFDNEMQFGGPALEVYASTDYAGNPATATWTQLAAVVDENTSSNTWVNSGDISLVEYVGGTVYIGFKYTSNTTDAPQWIIDNVLITELSASFVVNADNFNGAFGNVNLGSTSANSSFIVDAFALSGASVTVTPPAEFEVSLTSTFDAIGTNASPLTITVGNGGIVDNAEVFVRFAPSTTGVASGNIEIVTEGYSAETLSVSGTGVGFLDVNSSSFNSDFTQQQVGTISVSSSFIVNAAGLTGDVTVTPPVGYEVSLSNVFASIATNASPLTITATNNAVSNVTVYVRFAPPAVQSYNGNITVASTGFDNVTIAVTGTGTAPLSIAKEFGIYIYPNPTADMIMVNNTSNRVINMELYSIEGARMPLVAKGTNYDLSALNLGLYILVIKDEKGQQLGSERIMKK